MDLRGVGLHNVDMFELRWSQLAVANLQDAEPVFQRRDVPVTATHLAIGAIQLWLTDLDQPGCLVADLEKLLSATERERAAKFRFPIDRQRFIVRRALLRQLVASYIDRPAAGIEFTTNPFGKPQLATPCLQGNLQFNLSVAQGHALYGFAWNTALGVDLAQCRTEFDWTDIVDSFFHPNEATHIHQLLPPEQAQAFYTLWTLKEAIVKARGEGLTDPLVRTDFTSLLRNTSEACATDDGRRWSWTTWKPTDTAVAALAVER
ncbi:MAG: 4'-phosphopantetheinyl transferase superfamily protein [Verrucomicrobiota bacterium]